MQQDPQNPTTPVDNSDEACNARARAARGSEPPPEPSLFEALAAAKIDLVREAIDGEDAYVLAAQAYAVEALTRIVDRAMWIVAPEPTPAPYADVVEAALELATAVKSAGLTAEHFVGVFDGLLDPLENLSVVLEANGLEP